MRPQRNIFRLLFFIEAAVLLLVLLFGAVHMGGAAKRKESAVQAVPGTEEENQMQEDIAQPDAEPAAAEPGTETEEAAIPEPAVFPEAVTEKLASMTLEEKVAQLFLITPEALTHHDSVEMAGEDTRNALQTFPVGGLVYAASNFQSSEQTREMLSGVQQYSMERIGLPLFLAVEETGGNEGSPVALANAFPVQRSPAEIAAEGSPEAAVQAAGEIGNYLAEQGFNLNLLPTAELAAGADGLHDSKCYGADAAVASMMEAESIHAFHGKGIRTAAGCFPGRGSNTREPEAWKNEEALVFQAAVDAGTECFILGNAVYPALTGEETLCSLSPAAVLYMRRNMNYSGILMTDSLSEDAVTGSYSSGEAAVAAVKAGMNLLCCPADFEEAYQAILDAVNRGEISQDIIDQAAGYIVTQKLL